MNKYQSIETTPNNVKIIVRIRGLEYEKNKNAKLVKEDNPQKINKNSISSMKSLQISRTTSFGKKNNTAKSRSKSPNSIKNPNTLIKTTKLNDNGKYTIFTSIGPSNTLVSTNKAISGKLINDTFLNTNDLYEYSYSIIKDATLLEFDKVYNETHKMDTIYNEQIKECINNLFLAKNSCCLLFGPINSGKSYSLRGDGESASNESGLLGRAVQDLFNLVEISKQANLNSKNKQSTYFAIKMSVYQIYLDQVNDLLTSQFSKNLKLEKYSNTDNNLSTQIVDLTQKEVKSKKDYDTFMREAIQNRKLLAQLLKVNEMKRKSHLIISIFLEKRERINEGSHKTSEKSIDKFANIDFVELASSNYGLANLSAKKEDIKDYEDVLYKNTTKIFNSVCNNLVSSSTGKTTKYDSKLTLCLKNTLRNDSQIVFISCVLPWEEPPVNSFKSLKFTNWLRNQMHNVQENKNYKINSRFESENEEDAKLNRSYNDTKKKFLEDQNTINKSDDHYYARKMRTSPNLEQFSSNSNDEEKELRELRERVNKKYPYMNTNVEREQSNYKTLKTVPTEYNYRDEMMNNTNQGNESFMKKKQNLKEMEKSLRDLENKSVEMSRYIENLKMGRKVYSPGKNSEESHFNFKHSDFDNEKLKQEYSTIKSDNIIFREDINRLSELNSHLEEELNKQRNKNLELAADNERLLQEKNQMKIEIDKLNENASKVKVQDQNIMEQFNHRFLSENKIRELENENKTIKDEKQKFEVDFKVLSERYSELKKQFDNSEGELSFTRSKHSEEINNIEKKIDKMSKEMENLQRENNSFRVNEERIRQELTSMEKQRDNYRDKYQDYKSKNNLLNLKLTEIEDDLRKVMLEKQVEIFEKKKEDEMKKMKTDSKQKILEDMQNKISNYKSELFKSRVKKEDF